MTDTDRKVEVIAIVVATVASVAALVVSGITWYTGKQRADEANRIAASALKVAEDQSFASFSMSAFVYDVSPSGYRTKTKLTTMENPSKRPDWSVKEMYPNRFWLAIQVVNISNVPLILNDVGLITNADGTGFWIYGRKFTSPDCDNDSTDIRCFSFPVQVKSGEKVVLSWPFWEDASQIVESGSGNGVRIGFTATPTKRGTYYFKTNMYVHN